MICYRVPPADLRINYKSRLWCQLEYPGHKHGCPNFAHKPSCPPSAPLIQDYFDLTKPVYLLAIQFNLAEHAAKMVSLNLGWSDRQARCVLYWQPRVNKELEYAAKGFCTWSEVGKGIPDLIYTTCPEAMGVNVIATAQRLGIPVKVKPTEWVYKIALIGSRKCQA